MKNEETSEHKTTRLSRNWSSWRRWPRISGARAVQARPCRSWSFQCGLGVILVGGSLRMHWFSIGNNPLESTGTCWEEDSWRILLGRSRPFRGRCCWHPLTCEVWQSPGLRVDSWFMMICDDLWWFIFNLVQTTHVKVAKTALAMQRIRFNSRSEMSETCVLNCAQTNNLF